MLQGAVATKELDLPFLDPPLHFHNAHEIVLIMQGEGKRFVGDHVDQFSGGDLVIMGPKLPHFWRSDQHYLACKKQGAFRALIIYFRTDYFPAEEN